ncbi:MAG: efflux RND transporter periplasmic adaptor subunit [Rubrivivax sp.]|nr:efflux RND transporter periplasmic adaptor subunit [Rubrivivax sp.]
MKRTSTTAIAVVALVAAGALAWWVQQRPSVSASASAPGEARPANGGVPGGRGGPAAVEVGLVEAMRIVDATESVGTLRSRQGVMVRPEVSGRVAALGFIDGKPVRRGQLMLQLDDTLQRAQLQQAEAQAGIARTQVARNRELVAQGFVSQNAVDQSAAALEVAAAQVALAQAQLARLRVLAPFDGQAGIRQVNVGDYVKDGADIVSLVDAGQVWVDYRLPERYAARLRTGLTVRVALDALPGRDFEGRIEAIEGEVDVDGRALLVRARLDNRDGLLRPGMFARARTVFGVRERALVVPEEALVPEGGKQFLLRVLDSESGPVAERLEARLGTRLPGKVEILGGLDVGDRVVTAGQSRLMRGNRQPVRIVERGSADDGATKTPSRPASAARPAP